MADRNPTFVPFTGKSKNLTGLPFGRLTVVGYLGRVKNRHRWLCKCICGKEKDANGGNLLSGGTKSCGCLCRDAVVASNTRHGMAGSAEVRAWYGMMQRCYDKNSKNYKHYGERGIFVSEWWHDSANFLADMGKKPSPKHTLERIDNELGYFSANCRWATMTEQGSNKRNNRLLTADGVTRTISEWARLYDMKLHTLYARVVTRGWSLERAISTPVRHLNRSRGSL